MMPRRGPRERDDGQCRPFWFFDSSLGAMLTATATSSAAPPHFLEGRRVEQVQFAVWLRLLSQLVEQNVG
jgi:hypothetical protein